MRVYLFDPLAMTIQAALQLIVHRDGVKDDKERAELDLKVLGLIHSVWMRAQMYRWMNVSA